MARYDLHGIAEEPLAEEHVVVKCEAREKTSYAFQVKNHSKVTATFEARAAKKSQGSLGCL